MIEFDPVEKVEEIDPVRLPPECDKASDVFFRDADRVLRQNESEFLQGSANRLDIAVCATDEEVEILGKAGGRP